MRNNHTDWVSKPERWSGLKSLIMVKAEREDKKTGKKEEGTRFYISSKKKSAQFFNNAIRGHWPIETKLHWQLYVLFGEDNSKKVKENSVKRKRKMAGWNHN